MIDKNLRLSKDFSLKEFLVSACYPQLAAIIEPTPQMVTNLQCLCLFALQRIRDEVKKPLIIDSGVRSPAINAMVGGVPDSQHVDGSACDFIIIGEDMQALYWKISLWWPGELIYYKKKGHIHIALPKYGTKADHFVKDE